VTRRRLLRRARRSARIGGPLVVLAAMLSIATIVAVQFAGIVAKNVALAGDLARARADVVALRARDADESRTVARLSVPRGAVPEIHRALQLVGPHEEIIFLRGRVVAPTPGPGDWRPTP